MTLFWAQTFVTFLGLYTGLGVLFAFYFVIAGARRIDPAAVGMPVQARAIIFPASVLLWPYLAIKVIRAEEPPVQ